MTSLMLTWRSSSSRSTRSLGRAAFAGGVAANSASWAAVKLAAAGPAITIIAARTA